MHSTVRQISFLREVTASSLTSGILLRKADELDLTISLLLEQFDATSREFDDLNQEVVRLANETRDLTNQGQLRSFENYNEIKQVCKPMLFFFSGKFHGFQRFLENHLKITEIRIVFKNKNI